MERSPQCPDVLAAMLSDPIMNDRYPALRPIGVREQTAAMAAVTA